MEIQIAIMTWLASGPDLNLKNKFQIRYKFYDIVLLKELEDPRQDCVEI